jgi:hypothetical protein
MRYLVLLSLVTFNLLANTLTTESEVGQALSGGNTQTKSLTGKTSSYLVILKNKYHIESSFYRQTSSGTTVAEKWDVKISYERQLSEHFSASISHLAEADRFSGLNPRYNTDIGDVYYVTNNDKVVTSLALAYRYTHENTTEGTVNTANKIVLAFHHKKQVSEVFHYEFKSEYIPNLDISDAYIMNTEISFGANLNSNFSVKLNYTADYQNQPIISGNERLDYTQTLTLVSKF